MRKQFVLLVLVILLGLMVVANSVLAESHKETSRKQQWEQIWEEEILRADILMDARQFLEGEYSQAFRYKVFVFTNNVELQKKYLPLITKGTIFSQVQGLPLQDQRFIYAGYLGWYSEHRKNRMARADEVIIGNSEKYKIAVMPLPENDRYFRDKEARLLPPALFKTTAEEAAGKGGYFDLGSYGDFNFCAGGYNVDNNHLIIEERTLLPPALWLAFFYHEERHSYDDIVRHKNNPPRLPNNRNIRMIDFQLQGYAAAMFSWKLLKEGFLEGWERLGSDYNPAFLTSKLLLVDILITELLFDEYLLGNKSGLENYIEEAME